jgi:hypothetical protein
VEAPAGVGSSNSRTAADIGHRLWRCTRCSIEFEEGPAKDDASRARLAVEFGVEPSEVSLEDVEIDGCPVCGWNLWLELVA